METKESQKILPEKGIWTVQALAIYLDMRPADLTQKLTDNRVKVLHLSNRAKHKLIRLEDLRPNEKGE